jgi:hypothetical protein
MTKKTTTEVLIEMAETKNIEISVTAKIRNEFENIENARTAGAKLSDIVNALKADDIHISTAALSVTLCRIRAERGLIGKKLPKGVGSSTAKSIASTTKSQPSSSETTAASAKPQLAAESKEESINKTSLPGFGRKIPKRPTD